MVKARQPLRRTEFKRYEMKPCAECRGERPHNSKGACMACRRRAAAPIKEPRRSSWPSAAERFRDATEWGPPPDYRPELGPCLIYTGADNSGGYGQFRYNGRNGYAHRYAWESKHGPIPEGMTVDHLCRVRMCCNADHMELVDAVTNYLRGVEARNACPNGHPYDESTPRGANGTRRCPICSRATAKKSWLRRSRSANGLPNRKIKYDQVQVADVIARIRRAETTIAQGAREVGCNPNYLGRRTWNETKRDVFARDGHACQRCGTTSGTLDPHHRIARGRGGTTKPEVSFGLANLVTLCRACHDEVEAHPERSFQEGWRVRHGGRPAEIPIPTSSGWVLLTDEGGCEPCEPVSA